MGRSGAGRDASELFEKAGGHGLHVAALHVDRATDGAHSRIAKHRVKREWPVPGQHACWQACWRARNPAKRSSRSGCRSPPPPLAPDAPPPPRLDPGRRSSLPALLSRPLLPAAPPLPTARSHCAASAAEPFRRIPKPGTLGLGEAELCGSAGPAPLPGLRASADAHLAGAAPCAPRPAPHAGVGFAEPWDMLCLRGRPAQAASLPRLGARPTTAGPAPGGALPSDPPLNPAVCGDAACADAGIRPADEARLHGRLEPGSHLLVGLGLVRRALHARRAASAP